MTSGSRAGKFGLSVPVKKGNSAKTSDPSWEFPKEDFLVYGAE